MSAQFDPLPPEEPQEKKRRSCLFTTISGIIILSLLATSAFSLVWFMTNRTTATVESPPPTEIPQHEEATAQVTAEAVEQVVIESENPEISPPAAPESPRLDRIVFVNDDSQIETVAADGSDNRLLTAKAHAYEFPAWSPDGRQIAVLGANSSGSGIFLLQDEEEADDPEELYFSRNNIPFYLYWSPDSRQISFLASSPGSDMGLNVVDADSGEESEIIATGSPFYWNWAADSEDLLIHSGDQTDGARLALIDNSGQDQGSQIPAPGYFQAPGISPSGRYWAYSQLQDGGISWLTIDDKVDGEQLAERHAGSVALTWSPVEDKLAYISGEADSQFSFWGPLRLLDTTTGDTRVLSSNLVLAFFWSPDGKQIATISVPADDGINGGVEVRDIKSRHLARRGLASLSLQGVPHEFMLSVIDVETGTGLELANLSLPPSFLRQFLIFFDQYALSHILWSPDSDALVLPVLADGENQIVVISAKSGRMNQVGNGHMASWSRH